MGPLGLPGTYYNATVNNGGTPWDYVWSANLECGTFTPLSPNSTYPGVFWAHPTPQYCDTTEHQGDVVLKAVYAINAGGVWSASIWSCADRYGSESTTIHGSLGGNCEYHTFPLQSSTFQGLAAKGQLALAFSGATIENQKYATWKPEFSNAPSVQPPNSAVGSLQFNGIPPPPSGGSPFKGLQAQYLPASETSFGWITDQQTRTSPLTLETYYTTTVINSTFNPGTNTLSLTLNETSGPKGFIDLFYSNQILMGPFTATLDGSLVAVNSSTDSSGNNEVSDGNIPNGIHTLNITGTSSPAFDQFSGSTTTTTTTATIATSTTVSTSSKTTNTIPPSSTSSSSTTSSVATTSITPPSSTSSTTSLITTGIPELPYSLLGAATFVAVLVAAYVITRNRRSFP